MGKVRQSRSTSPQTVAAITSTLVLVVGLGIGFYFMELRGPGIQSWMAGPRAQEVLVLFAGLAAIVLTGHLAVASAVNRARSSQPLRELLRQVEEVDPTDPDALSRFDAVPELRDVVSLWVTEKSQNQQLVDQVEAVRGELRGLVAGMRRSVAEMGPMREENLSELGAQMAALWNELIARVAEGSSPAPAAHADVPDALGLPGHVVDLPAGEPGAADADALAKLAARVQQLEARLQTLSAGVPPHAPDPGVVHAAARPADPVQADYAPVVPEVESGPPPAVVSRNAPQSAADDVPPLVADVPQVTSHPEVDAGRFQEWGGAADGPPAPVASDGFEDVPRVAEPPGGEPQESTDDASVFESHFPHFVGRPVTPETEPAPAAPEAAPRVEVTYESTSSMPQPPDLPESTRLFAPEPEPTDEDAGPVVDLRSLGAVEYRE